MRYAALILLIFLLAGCGASYSITRTTPDGATLSAQAWTAESTDSVEFRFAGNLQTGEVSRLSLIKTGAQPVSLTAQTLQTVLGAIPAATNP